MRNFNLIFNSFSGWKHLTNKYLRKGQARRESPFKKSVWFACISLSSFWGVSSKGAPGFLRCSLINSRWPYDASDYCRKEINIKKNKKISKINKEPDRKAAEGIRRRNKIKTHGALCVILYQTFLRCLR